MSTEWKKRKVELEEPPTEDQVKESISLWAPDQLVRVLSKLGAEHSVVLQEILRENQNDPKLRKIFVRNLPYTVTQASFREFFSQYGTVTEAVIIEDKVTKASKGFGFVTYETVEAANSCLVEPTKDIDGRQIFVNLAAKKDGLALGGVATGPGAVGRRDEDNTTRKLFVWSLSYETTSQQLLDFFKSWGEVTEAVVLTNRESGTSKGYGFVTMGTSEAAQSALLDPVKTMAGRSIHVKLAAASDGKHSGTASQGGTLLSSPPSYAQYGSMSMGMYPGMMGMMPASGGYPAQTQQYAYPGGANPGSYPAGYPGWS